MHRDLREYLTRLAREDELVIIEREVDPCFELTAVIRHLRDKPVFFERVRGADLPVVGNLFGNYRTLEVLFETPRDRLLIEYLERARHRRKVSVVPDGPVHENSLLGDDVDVRRLPLPTHNELDGGPYIDAGILIANDPEFGYNLSIQRMQVTGPRRVGIWIAPMMHLERYRQRAEENGSGLEVAVAIGCDPSIYVASQLYGAIGDDEYEAAGAMRGAPVEVVRCTTVDLVVPATAEIVLEGRILPGVREPEGPFGEFTGYYGAAGMRPVVEFTAMHWRNDPIFQTIYIRKPPTENVYLTAVPKAAELYAHVQRVAPEVRNVFLTPGGCGKFHAVISMRKRHEGEAKQALLAALSSHLAVKHAVVVDDDIDIYDPHDVEWAIATRSQFDVDSVVVTGLPHNLDPSATEHPNDLITKVGIDATIPLAYEYPVTCDVPAGVISQVREHWAEYGARSARDEADRFG